MPLDVQIFDLATGPRGIGFAAVYGTDPLLLEDFFRFRYLQHRLTQMETEEGRKDLEIEVGMNVAIELDEEERSHPRQEPKTIPPFDPATMTSEQVEDWLRKYGSN